MSHQTIHRGETDLRGRGQRYLPFVEENTEGIGEEEEETTTNRRNGNKRGQRRHFYSRNFLKDVFTYISSRSFEIAYLLL